MNRIDRQFSTWVFLATGCAAIAATGCHTGPSAANVQAQAQATAQSHAKPAIDLSCMPARFANPAEPFHYSYDRAGHSDFVKLEADVTPNSIDGVLNTEWDGNPSPPLPLHAVRSDTAAWGQTLGNLNAGLGMPSSLMEANMMQRSLVREATGQVNGYDSIRYSLDTARLDAGDRSILGSSEKGTVWVSNSGCPVKWSIVTELKNKDGSIDRTQYEGNVIKK